MMLCTATPVRACVCMRVCVCVRVRVLRVCACVQATGIDIGTQIEQTPSDEMVISWARELLSLPDQA